MNNTEKNCPLSLLGPESIPSRLPVTLLPWGMPIPWSAIAVGIIIASAFCLTTALLGAVIAEIWGGSSSLLAPENRLGSWPIGLWYLLTTMMAFFLCGYASAKFADVPEEWANDKMYLVFLWGVTLLALMTLFGTPATGGGALSFPVAFARNVEFSPAIMFWTLSAVLMGIPSTALGHRCHIQSVELRDIADEQENVAES
jgi:hypothetical protein